MSTGKWADFAGDVKGGDLISLYAAIEGITQVESANQLSQKISFTSNNHAPARQEEPEITMPPAGTEVPDAMSRFQHIRFGRPKHVWFYRNGEGRLLFCVARYDIDGDKQFIPWSWCAGRWIAKGWAAPRPLYGLDRLSRMVGKPVLICEGEKAADAAQKIVGDVYAVISWPNGSKAAGKCDWSPVHGRRVLLWPDADLPGRKAAQEIALLLQPHCPEVKMLEPEEGDGDEKHDGWDAADALAEGWNFEQLVAWARPRASIFKWTDPNSQLIHDAAKASPIRIEAVAQVPQAIAAVQVNIETSDKDNLPDSVYAIWDELGIARNQQGSPIMNADNVLRVFEKLNRFKDFIWFDTFHQKYFTRTPSGGAREWSDDDDLSVMAFFQRDLGLSRMSDDFISKAIRIHGRRHQRNEPHDWMETLKWDGIERLEHFFVECFGVEDTDYTRAAAKNWWISMVARIYHPGSKVDNMVILEGGQGKFKSTALGVIGGKWYTESHESVTSKDFYLLMQGKLIVEISELDAFSKAEVNTIKKVITCQTDRYRPPYSRSSQDFPRQCVFVGTTNEEAYLRDHTGARRFWPVRIHEIKLELIRSQRDQLFAEAVHRYKASERWWEMPLESTKANQEARRQVDEWESVISTYTAGKFQIMTSDIATDCLRIDIGRLDHQTQRRIGTILRTLGWSKKNSRYSGRVVKIWERPETQEAS